MSERRKRQPAYEILSNIASELSFFKNYAENEARRQVVLELEPKKMGIWLRRVDKT